MLKVRPRAEVDQELIEPQQNSLNYITETSYPDVNPMFTAQVAHMKQQLAQQDAATANSAANQTTSASFRLPRRTGCCARCEASSERKLGIRKPARLFCYAERRSN